MGDPATQQQNGLSQEAPVPRATAAAPFATKLALYKDAFEAAEDAAKATPAKADVAVPATLTVNEMKKLMDDLPPCAKQAKAIMLEHIKAAVDTERIQLQASKDNREHLSTLQQQTLQDINDLDTAIAKMQPHIHQPQMRQFVEEALYDMKACEAQLQVIAVQISTADAHISSLQQPPEPSHEAILLRVNSP